MAWRMADVLGNESVTPWQIQASNLVIATVVEREGVSNTAETMNLR
jgi:hypothetical protein